MRATNAAPEAPEPIATPTSPAAAHMRSHHVRRAIAVLGGYLLVSGARWRHLVLLRQVGSPQARARARIDSTTSVFASA